MRIATRLPREARVFAAVSLVYVGVAILWTAPSSLAPASTLPDLRDPLHLSWVLAWDAHQLVRRPWALFDSNSFYPYPRSLAFSDHLLPEALVVAPIFWATGNAVLAYNLAVLVALASSALAMFALVRRITGSAGAGLVAGLAYAFNSFTQHEIVRVQVVNLQWWPLALLFLDRFASQGRARDAWLGAGAGVLQGLSGSYYLIYTLLVLPVWLAGIYAGVGRRPTWKDARTIGVALAVAAAPAALILWPYLSQFRAMGFEKTFAPGADALSYVTLRARSELPHFLGIAGLALMAGGALVALARRRDGSRVGLIAVATALMGFVLSLGPLVMVGGWALVAGPYAFLHAHVRFFRGMASPERIGVLVILGQAILVGIAVAALLGRLGASRRPIAVAILAVVVPLEHWRPARPAAPVPTGDRVPAVYRWLAAEPRGPLVELPIFPERTKVLRGAYLYFSTYHWRPVPIGRTSFYPPAHEYLAWNLRDFPDDTSLLLLSRLGIRRIVVHPNLWQPGERAQRLAALDADPRLRLDRRFDDRTDAAYAALGLGEERAYTLLADAPAPPEPCAPVDEIPREGWVLRSSGRKQPDLVRDGDRRTAWFTNLPQRPRDFLEVELPRPETVSAIALELYYPHDEFPRNLVVLVSEDAASWRRVEYADGPEERWAGLADLLRHPREARLILRIPPQTVRGVRLMVGLREQEDAWTQWSVPELRIYSDCRS